MVLGLLAGLLAGCYSLAGLLAGCYSLVGLLAGCYSLAGLLAGCYSLAGLLAGFVFASWLAIFPARICYTAWVIIKARIFDDLNDR